MLHFCIEWPICRRQKMIFRRQSGARTICLSISCVFVQKKRISIFDFRILSRRQNSIFRRQTDVEMNCLPIFCIFVQKKRISIFDFRIPTSTSKDDFSSSLIFAKNIWGSLSRTPAAIIRTLQGTPFRCEPDNHLRRIVDGLKCRK